MSPAVPVPSRGRFRSPAVLAPLLVGLLGLGISLVGMTAPSIWYDEAATVVSTTRTLPQLLDEVGTVDAVHALYYLLMHGLFEVFGYSPFLLRLPSAVAVGVAAALVVVLGARLERARLGVIAGIVFCLLPRVTWMGTEGRSYAISAALAVALTLVLVVAVRSPRRVWPWVGYGVLVVVSCVTFLYLALLVVAHAVTMAIWLALRRREAWRAFLGWAVASGLGAAAVLPFALEVVSQSEQVSWLPRVGWDTWRQVFRTQWFLFNDLFAWLVWVPIAIGAVLLMRRSQPFSTASLVLPAMIVPVLGLLAMTELRSPVYSPRYVTFCTPFVAIVVAAAFDALRARAAVVVALVATAAVSVPSIIDQRTLTDKQGTAWSEVSDFLDERIDDPASTGIVYGTLRRHSKATTRAVAVSYPQGFEGTRDLTIDTPGAERGELWETRLPLQRTLDRLDGLESVYLVTSTTRDTRPATTATLAGAGWDPVDEWRFADVRVVEYAPAD